MPTQEAIQRPDQVQSKPLQQAEQRRAGILDVDESTYAEQDLSKFVQTLDHISHAEQQALLQVLQQSDKLFSSGLGTAKVKSVDFELVPDAKPYHFKQPFSIPRCYQETTKKEIDCLVHLGVLENTLIPNGPVALSSLGRKQTTSELSWTSVCSTISS